MDLFLHYSVSVFALSVCQRRLVSFIANEKSLREGRCHLRDLSLPFILEQIAVLDLSCFRFTEHSETSLLKVPSLYTVCTDITSDYFMDYNPEHFKLMRITYMLLYLWCLAFILFRV